MTAHVAYPAVDPTGQPATLSPIFLQRVLRDGSYARELAEAGRQRARIAQMRDAQARQLVQTLVDQRLIACGTIIPGAKSVYRWQAKVTAQDEVVVLLKTSRKRWDALKVAIEAHHPYHVPELLAIPVQAGLKPYLDWVASETS